MEYPFAYYGHSGVAPPLHARVPAPARRPMFPAPGREHAGAFGFSRNYSGFLGRLRSSKSTVPVRWAGHDRLTVSRHFQPGMFSRELTRSRAFAFGSRGGGLAGLGSA
jgi:hypothetical protein